MTETAFSSHVSSAFVAAVDWGTSSFRLWLLDREGKVLAQSKSSEGMMHASQTGFPAILEKHLSAVGADTSLPVLICGMAGARQGWVEAPYVTIPATLEQLARSTKSVVDSKRDIRILPGAAQKNPEVPDVMRGEETQLLGLGSVAANSLVCMPGTHSKWVQMRDGAISGFTTYMTGELFSVISQHSILKLTLTEEHGGNDVPAVFLDMARHAIENPDALIQGLFKLRAGQLLGFSQFSDGSARLSGLLIGAEIGAGLREYPGIQSPVLISDGRLGTLYRAAMEIAGLNPVIVDADGITRSGLYSIARQIWAE